MNRRRFLLGSTALIAAIALPDIPLAEAGRFSPLIRSRVRGVLAVEVDPTRLIYSVFDGPIASIDAVYEGGVLIEQSEKFPPSAGQWAECPDHDGFQLGTMPYYPVTVDATVDGIVYVETYTYGPGERSPWAVTA